MYFKLYTPFVFFLNYFTIFYICYVDKEYKSISDYPGFFAQYFLLGISLFFYNVKLYTTRITINLRLYFIYQISFLIYTVIASLAVPNYIFNIPSINTPYLVYLCGIGLLVLNKLVILHSNYKEETDRLPFHQI
jgi:hypothetical protein